MTPDPMPPATSGELERKLGILVWAFVVLAAGIMAVLGLVGVRIAMIVPTFERIFAEMLGDKPLPGMTQGLIELSRLAAGWLLPILALMLPAVGIAFLMAFRTRPVAWMVAVGTIFLQMAVAALVVFALYLPMMSIIVEMNGH